MYDEEQDQSPMLNRDITEADGPVSNRRNISLNKECQKESAYNSYDLSKENETAHTLKVTDSNNVGHPIDKIQVMVPEKQQEDRKIQLQHPDHVAEMRRQKRIGNVLKDSVISSKKKTPTRTLAEGFSRNNA